MKIIYSILVIALLTACKKDNPPPANNGGNQNTDPPVPMVDLNCHFLAIVNGTPVEYTENVVGFSGSANHNYILLPSPSYSSAVYRFGMSSTASSSAIQIFLGTVYWDRGVSLDPTEIQFDSFMNSNLSPSYSADAQNGFEVQYTDNTGTVWKSNAASLNPQDVSFSNVTQDSDTTGHYSLFTVQFNCYVYNASLTDSLLIQNGQMTGWFEK